MMVDGIESTKNHWPVAPISMQAWQQEDGRHQAVGIVHDRICVFVVLEIQALFLAPK